MGAEVYPDRYIIALHPVTINRGDYIGLGYCSELSFIKGMSVIFSAYHKPYHIGNIIKLGI